MGETDRVFGLETEYSFAPQSRGGKPIAPGSALGPLMALARERLAYLPGGARGVGNLYLGNGARLYVDCGNHPEYATPEVTDPVDAVRYQLAGDEIMTGLAAGLEEQHAEIDRALFFKGNVDYWNAGVTWGAHESYMYRADPEEMPTHLIPHLVSRMILSGAGGFNNRAPGIEFVLSPRVAHLHNVVSSDSTCNRGIFHTKDESLSKSGFHRLHVLCGESCCSHTSSYLRVGTTALVVLLAEAGRGPERCLVLDSPLCALNAIATDATCAVRVPVMLNGRHRELTAIEIQRFYLEAAESCAGEPFMPSWSESVCKKWRRVLGELEESPERMAGTLDWAIKHALYESYIGRRGFSWAEINRWNGELKKAGLQPPDPGLEEFELPTGHLNRGSILDLLRPRIRGTDLKPDRLSDFLTLRNQLCELDVRYAQLGREGLFGELERANVLDHAIDGVDRIEEACTKPPASGRARLRGDFIQAHTAQSTRFHCGWSRVIDIDEHRQMDLSDPFARESQWAALPGRSTSRGRSTVLQLLAENLREEVVDFREL